AGRQNTDMVYVLKELKILEGIGGFESPPLLGLKGTEAPQIPLAIGAVAPRSLVKMPLGQENLGILLLQRLVCIGIGIIPLSSKQGGRLLLYHFPGDGKAVIPGGVVGFPPEFSV